MKGDNLKEIPIQQGEYIESASVYGTLQSKVKGSIISSTSGRIKLLFLYPGMQVEKGQVLATLENFELKRSLIDIKLNLEEQKLNLEAFLATTEESKIQQSSNLELSKAKIKLFQSKVRANSELYSKNIISKFDFETVKLELQQANIELDMHRKKLITSDITTKTKKKILEFSIQKLNAQVQLIQKDINNLKVKAEISGVVTKVSNDLELGQIFNIGDKLGQISDISSIYAELYVSSSEASKIKLNQIVKLKILNETVLATVTNINQNVEKGAVRLDAELKSKETYRPNTPTVGDVVFYSKVNSILIPSSSISKEELNSKVLFYLDSENSVIHSNLKIERSNGNFYLMSGFMPNTDKLFIEH